ncbi:uncharacterized protein PFL1_03970 [Pseudozyma flocculosa PF-1]|uniref:Altered inheritance of mitochondria protein 41 n=2 Tax=Pseudozyma flocculosa TaxID=84751 RepID=A0A5C3EY95_9BASI|nr:uncharacterized protein PFL1_03970 [Pseudozyma flocculosa PF-1]EPQ28667.1 hypothetical protein PFL1_03970 [Pseudozyma flocculosa PF-1]SPO36616.1 uncharacterized protein PSFLO_02087 [Pseudozyma flocculosa]
MLAHRFGFRAARQAAVVPALGASRSFGASACRRDATGAPKNDGDAALLASIKAGLKDAMRSKDSVTSTVLRSVLSDHQYTTLSTSPTSLSSILQKGISKRTEAATQFRSASRADLAEQEEREAEILAKFLPQQLSLDEVEAAVRTALDKLKHEGKVDLANAKKALGSLIKETNASVDKSRTSGKVVSEVCSKVLASL